MDPESNTPQKNRPETRNEIVRSYTQGLGHFRAEQFHYKTTTAKVTFWLDLPLKAVLRRVWLACCLRDPTDSTTIWGAVGKLSWLANETQVAEDPWEVWHSVTPDSYPFISGGVTFAASFAMQTGSNTKDGLRLTAIDIDNIENYTVVVLPFDLMVEANRLQFDCNLHTLTAAGVLLGVRILSQYPLVNVRPEVDSP